MPITLVSNQRSGYLYDDLLKYFTRSVDNSVSSTPFICPSLFPYTTTTPVFVYAFETYRQGSLVVVTTVFGRFHNNRKEKKKHHSRTGIVRERRNEFRTVVAAIRSVFNCKRVYTRCFSKTNENFSISRACGVRMCAHFSSPSLINLLEGWFSRCVFMTDGFFKFLNRQT